MALAAQGFGLPRPTGGKDARHLRRVLEHTQLLQIDSVNVLARAHYLPLFSRLGAYPEALLDRAAWGRPRALFEYWAHEASLLPVDLHPNLRWRMERAERGEGTWARMRAFAGARRGEADAVLRRIQAEGPLAASDFDRASVRSGWSEWSDAKTALEWLFWSGRIAAATRRTSFERVYDLAERVIPPHILALPTPSKGDAQRALLERSARALGIATAADLRDYFRLKPESTPRIEELVEAGSLRRVSVEGWRQPAYLHSEAKLPRRIRAAALLAPFDPLIWERGRTERLFGFHYRIGIYTPPEKRVHGYYVLPFLMDEAIVARVDLKADRQAGVLRVQSAWAEPNAPAGTAERLAAELRLMASWLRLAEVRIERRGDLHPALSVAVQSSLSPAGRGLG
jgi:hypothetical protein